MIHGDHDTVIARCNNIFWKAGPFSSQEDCYLLIRPDIVIINARRIFGQRHRDGLKAMLIEGFQYCLTGRIFKRRLRPRDLENSAHARPCSTPRKRIDRCVRKKHSVHSERGRRPEYRTDICRICDVDQNRDALFIFEELFHSQVRLALKRHPQPAHQRVPGQVDHHVFGRNINGNVFFYVFAAVLFDRLENRACLNFQPSLFNEHRQRLVSVFERTQNNIRALCKKNARFRLIHRAEFAFGDPRENIHLRSVNVFYFDQVHGNSSQIDY